MHYVNDTIAAPATPPGEGAIAVLRLSGPRSWEIFSRLLAAENFPPPPRQMIRGNLQNAGLPVDDVLYCYYAAPASYTGEDMVEIFCHGSPLLLSHLLQALCAAGARPAAPGEFTQRAYLNGKMDLVQAEAVAGLIAARSEQAQQAALRHLSGHLSTVFKEIQKDLLDILALVEANIDFSAEDIDLLPIENLRQRIRGVAARLRDLGASYRTGRALFQGIRVAVTGRPNAGKSSLLNALLGRDEIIVDHRPGTTRDFIEKEWEFAGLRLLLTDTAGLRETEDPVEKIGVQKAYEIIRQAQSAVYLADGTLPPDPIDETNFRDLAPAEKIFVYTKTDLPCHPQVRQRAAEKGRPLISISQPASLQALCQAVVAPWQAQDRGQEVLATERQAAAVARTVEALDAVLGSLDEKILAEEIIALDLRHALDALATVTGGITDEDVLREIFGRFCIGK